MSMDQNQIDAYGGAIAMAARQPAPQPTKWQLIETAPKDGRLILVKEERCSGLAVMYSGGWKYESGNICYLQPTHWMPLPPASQQTHEEQK